jgi:hypothetical protein
VKKQNFLLKKLYIIFIAYFVGIWTDTYCLQRQFFPLALKRKQPLLGFIPNKGVSCPLPTTTKLIMGDSIAKAIDTVTVHQYIDPCPSGNAF